VYVGGSSEAAARRAAGRADGFDARPEFIDIYIDECRRLGIAPGRVDRAKPVHSYLHVTEDPDRDWAHIEPFAIHEGNSFAAWASHGNVPVGMATGGGPDAIRTSGKYIVVTPRECVEFAKGLGPDSALRLHPLMGGIDPDFGWSGLELFAAKVLPELRTLGLVPPKQPKSDE
jgi:hypothetical protein